MTSRRNSAPNLAEAPASLAATIRALRPAEVDIVPVQRLEPPPQKRDPSAAKRMRELRHRQVYGAKSTRIAPTGKTLEGLIDIGVLNADSIDGDDARGKAINDYVARTVERDRRSMPLRPRK